MTTVIKVGGNLCREMEVLEGLCRVLEGFEDLLVVPGGGRFADAVREMDREFNLDAGTAHRLAILAMQQTGMLIGKFFGGEVLDCSSLLYDDNLPESWNVTSDSIAAYVARKREAEKLVLLKGVDGVFTAEPNKEGAKLIPELTVEELSTMENSCLDREFPSFVRGSGLEVWVVNGRCTARVESILKKKKTKGTRIL